MDGIYAVQIDRTPHRERDRLTLPCDLRSTTHDAHAVQPFIDALFRMAVNDGGDVVRLREGFAHVAGICFRTPLKRRIVFSHNKDVRHGAPCPGWDRDITLA